MKPRRRSSRSARRASRASDITGEKMRRIIYRRYGDPTAVLTQIEEPTPSPGAGEVLVNLAVRPVHSGDILMVTGTHDPVQRPVPPEGFTPGCEGTGIVEAIGPGVDPW